MPTGCRWPPRNMVRGKASCCPAGETVARSMGRPEAEIRADLGRRPPGRSRSAGAPPLWFYLLKEAELIGREKPGRHPDAGRGAGPGRCHHRRRNHHRVDRAGPAVPGSAPTATGVRCSATTSPGWKYRPSAIWSPTAERAALTGFNPARARLARSRSLAHARNATQAPAHADRSRRASPGSAGNSCRRMPCGATPSGPRLRR